MKTLLYGLAALPLLATVAFAQPPVQSNDSAAVAKQPMQLSETQMDKVTAGWGLVETDIGNTSTVLVSVWQSPSNVITCPGCYLLINSPSLSIASAFGPPVAQ